MKKKLIVFFFLFFVFPKIATATETYCSNNLDQLALKNINNHLCLSRLKDLVLVSPTTTKQTHDTVDMLRTNEESSGEPLHVIAAYDKLPLTSRLFPE